jgi:three-Cys-motif partner protein
MTVDEFFDEPREQSRIKSRIVAKYFYAWAKIIMPRARDNKIAYMDLFSGPGRYSDGTDSTPIIVLKEAIKEPRLRKMLFAYFNDKDPANVQSLQKAIGEIPGVDTLQFKPRVENEEVGQRIVESLRQMNLIPTLLFIDPWGYKGLSLALIGSVLKDWGCDCIFFFNYNRINPGINNELVRERMNDLFGEQRADAIRAKLKRLNPTAEQREDLIIEEFTQALKETGSKYVLPFTFRGEKDRRTSHYIIFATKNFTGYKIMKGIMARESSEQDEGVPSLEYSPGPKNLPFQFAAPKRLDELGETLLLEFAGKELTMLQVYEHHSVEKPYLKQNYKKALTKLEAAGRISAKPPAKERPKWKGEVTFADNVVVKFPPGVEK